MKTWKAHRNAVDVELLGAEASSSIKVSASPKE